MKIYLDSDYCCHLANDGTMREIETDIFDGRCRIYIEGYRYVPEGETWLRADGTTFSGIMLSPAESYNALEKAQEQYELDQADAADMLEALQILGVTE